jgi:hypothetical protein
LRTAAEDQFIAMLADPNAGIVFSIIEAMISIRS